MKILFLVSNLKAIGGIQEYNRNFLRAIREVKKDDIRAIELKNGVFGGKPRFIFNFFKYLFLFSPNLIICGHINFAPLGYFFKKFFGKNYAVLTYGIDVWELKYKQIKYLKNARIISTISTYTKSRLLAAVPELEEKIFMLPNAVDGGRFKSAPKPAALTKRLGIEDNKTILTISRLAKSEKYKGYDKIIQALPAIIKEIKNVKYVLVGNGDDALRIKQLIKDLKIEEYVIMPGYVSEEEVVDYYNLCDVFAMPSKGEGFGFVFIEALACGKPVIAGNSDGSRDALLDGELGILVNPENTKEITESIIKVLKKETSNKLLDGQYLRKRVLKVYGFDKFKERTKNLLYELSR